MHVVVVGASGATGHLVVQQALTAGHRVTALVRDPTQYRAPKDVTVVRADVANEATVDLPDDADVIISALGKTSAKDPVSTCMLGVVHLLAAMRERGPNRLVAISAQPVLRSGYGMSVFTRQVLMRLVRFWGRNIYPDLERMEHYLSTAGDWCDWTVVRPGYLQDAGEVGSFQLVPDANVPGSTRRPDLAAALLRVADDATTYRRAYGVASR
ncbi:putative NADH-flavin reductase [Tamaricihabitans halophyticus]|uniref:Putative NADH-flavin reductase n=1 Tax=Tamaricihabitans halophyticus TaxID=1262583 RepID=A0A4R2QU47_9PSEU|nr:NAD(P)-binding oxidoreductase [Tamaricihabitans halophyticus]TCP53483.1 putative NADH-flavin reductase [Tamaricihabitans halophyticus]